ncbi:putative MFS family arabinose efflux permease [Kutzneria buriramensis]|uniref:Putative MFS family arabinose efflux permease n=1 Tax=Kutzneria buriramensis TaxID=1045776 RepID=A0A3E0HIH3_9PSEU|nr:putative MFS family arabinose efflux permease [Kutzneria buriramensis]
MRAGPVGRSRPVTSRRTAFRIVAAAFAVTMSGTTMPTPLYPLYQRAMGFSTLTTTVVFAAYAVGVLTALLLVGRASDVIGRRRTLLPGLACAASSAILFLVADDVGTLIAARLLSGLSAGIFTGTATATLVDFDDDRGRATLVAAVANMGGLGAGPLVSGLLAQYAPAPLCLPFLVHLLLVVAVGWGIRAIPEPVTARSPRELRIARLSVPTAMRATFVGAAVAGFASFAVLGLFTAVTPLFLRTLLAVPDPAPAGLLVCWLLVASTFGQAVLVPRLRERALPVGSGTLALGALVLAGALAVGSLTLLLVATTLAGLGQGTTFRATLALLTAASPPDRRAEIASSFFVVAYVAISAPVVGEGLAAQLVGLRTAGVGFGAAVAVLAAVATATARFRPTAPPAP